MASLTELHRKLITANHILHYQNVVDAYGHISVRHPEKPDVYIMSGSLAPAVVSSPGDLIEYHVSDDSPVDPAAKKGYQERFIHGEMYKKFAGVNCVIHSHAEAVMPYVTSGVPLQPVMHMAGFLGEDVPVFDIAPLYTPSDRQDLLVNTTRLGAALASHFTTAPSSATSTSPAHNVVLMRRHGFTTHAADIESAVYRAIYTKVNAGIQTQAALLRNAYGDAGVQMKFDLEPLTGLQCVGAAQTNEGTKERPWGLWVLEVAKSNLYTNKD